MQLCRPHLHPFSIPECDPSLASLVCVSCLISIGGDWPRLAAIRRIAVADFSGMKEVAKDVIEVLVKEHVARFFFGLRVLTYERDLLISHLVAKTLSGPPEGGEGEEGSGKKSMLAAAPRVANPHLFVILRPNYDDKRKSCWGLQWSTETVVRTLHLPPNYTPHTTNTTQHNT